MPDSVGVSVAPYATLGQSSGSNLLGPVGQVVGIQNAMNQNLLFQQTYRARQAMGVLAQQAVDPETGQMDYNKYGTLISQHPETAWMAPEVLNELAQKQLIQTETMNQQLDIAAKRQAAIGAAANSVATQKGDNVKLSDLAGPMSDLVSQGFFSPKDAVAQLSGWASEGLKGPQLRQRLLQISAAAQRGSELINGVNGTYQEVLGPDGSKRGVFVSPQMGQATPATMAPTPQGAAAGGGAPGAAAPPQGVTTQMSPFQASEQQDVADYEKGLNNRVRDANQLLALFSQTQDALKDFKPGAGMTAYATLAQMAQAAGLPQDTVDALVGASKNGLGSVQEARKLFFGAGAQVASQMIKAGDGRLTQAEWAKTLAEGAPNIDMDPRGVRQIMRAMQELAGYTKLESQYFNGKKALSRVGGYDISNAQNDWGNVLGELISRRGQQSAQ